MENNNQEKQCEENNVRARKKRTRSVSSSSNSSNSSSSDSSARRHRSKNKKVKRRKQNNDSLIENLAKQVNDLQNHLFYHNQKPTLHNEQDISDINFDDSRLLSEEENDTQAATPVPPNYNITLSTTIKEPSVPKAAPEYLASLQTVQRFGDSEWSGIRYAEAQKAFSCSPGFVELECNEEVKSFEGARSRHLQLSERSYAALTLALLKQQESLQVGIRDFLSWIQNSSDNLSFDSIKEKIYNTFCGGDFHKVSSDTLQLVCGRRADAVEQRRDNILALTKDPLIKSALRKIPPTFSYLFEPVAFCTTLEKVGGIKKAFWSQPKVHSNKLGAQPSTSGMSRFPAQGNTMYAPTQGGNKNKLHAPAQGGTCCPIPTNWNYNREGHHGEHNYYRDAGQVNPYHSRDPFRGRSSGQAKRGNRGTSRGGGKRPGSPPYKSNNRQRKY